MARTQNMAAKCLRVSSTTTAEEVIKELVHKFHPGQKLLSRYSSYTLYELHKCEGL